MCLCSGETVDHLLMHCNEARPISCGALSSNLWGSTGSYWREQLILCLAGGTGWVNILRAFGIWFRYS